jgi:hypothetical protein
MNGRIARLNDSFEGKPQQAAKFLEDATLRSAELRAASNVLRRSR